MRILSITVATISIMLSHLVPLHAQNRLIGDWEGHIDVQGTKLSIITHFSNANDSLTGSIDIPQQGASGLTIENIMVNQDSVHFDFFAGMGMAEFRGHLNSDTLMDGTFHQNGQSFGFELTKRTTNEPNKEIQNAPPTYNQEELIIQNDSVSIGGTLTWPQNQATDKLVIIISGSGAQDRDGQLPGISFEPYGKLAQTLTPNGIATFRYDDRGVGQSGGEFSNASLNILASDVEAMINHFRRSSEHTFSDITLLGHSQGGLVAGKVAAKTNLVDRLVLMASPGVTLKKVLRFQVQQAFTQAGVDSSLIDKEIDAREQLMEAIATNQKINSAQTSYSQEFAQLQQAMGVDSARAKMMAQQQVNALTSMFTSPQVQSLLFYDPTTDLDDLDIPVLVLFGGNDTQVTVEMNKYPIENALKSAGVPYQTKVFKQANHLFQKANTGSVQEYSTLESKFVDELIPTVTKWIKN